MMGGATALALNLAERRVAPDALIRLGIRRACGSRLAEVRAKWEADRAAQLVAFLAELNGLEIAECPAKANEQHYELPPDFFGKVLGPHRKYSCCYWPEGVHDLSVAEARALEVNCEHAGLDDGMSVLDMGCGWGSMSLFMAERYPRSEVLGVSNSTPQRHYIEGVAAERGLTNLKIVTADINSFDPGRRFDRVVSVEMLEHVRNHRRLFARVATWLRPGGRMFAHVFRHKDYGYLFEEDGTANWMGRHFFTGGLMPSANLLRQFPESFACLEQWDWDGTHYEKTSNAWLANLDRHEGEIRAILKAHYGATEADVWLQRWRIFFMACAELFGYAHGSEWGVSHYLFAAPG